MTTDSDSDSDSDGSTDDEKPALEEFGPNGEPPATDDDSETESTATRHWLTNDVLALWLVLTFPAVITADAAGMIALGTVPETVVLGYLLIVGTAVAWSFGKDAVEAWRQGH